jgi:hypothetical protein
MNDYHTNIFKRLKQGHTLSTGNVPFYLTLEVFNLIAMSHKLNAQINLKYLQNKFCSHIVQNKGELNILYLK